MSDITTTLKWKTGWAFSAKNGAGSETILDGKREVGPSPMELLIEAIGGCSAIDVVSILEKMRQPMTALELTMEGDRHESQPRYFRKARASFDIWGDGLDQERVERAIHLSFVRYCSVFHSLRKDLNFTAVYRIHAAGAAPSGEYRAVSLAEQAA